MLMLVSYSHVLSAIGRTLLYSDLSPVL